MTTQISQRYRVQNTLTLDNTDLSNTQGREHLMLDNTDLSNTQNTEHFMLDTTELCNTQVQNTLCLTTQTSKTHRYRTLYA